MNTLIHGEPGSGKSTGMLVDAIPGLPWRAQLVLDFHRTFALLFLTWCIRLGLAARLIVDDLAMISRVLGYRIGTPFTYGSVQGEMDEDAEIRGLLQFLFLTRGFGSNIYEHPFMANLWWAIRLVLHQRVPVPFRMLRYALSLHSSECRQLLKGCWDSEVLDKYDEFFVLPPMERERQLGPGRRLLESLFGTPVVRERWVGEFDIVEHFRRRGILVLMGSHKVSEESMRAHFGMVLMRAILGAMEHGFGLDIYIDEWVELANPWLGRKLEECRKYDIHISLAGQFIPQEFRDRAVQACGIRKYYRCSGAVAEFAASDLSGLLDRDLVHHYDERIQRIPQTEEYERITQSKSNNGKWGRDRRVTEGTSATTAERTIWSEFVQRVPVYEKPGDQRIWRAQELGEFGDGDRFVRDKSGTHREHVLQLPEPFGNAAFAAHQREIALQEIYARSCYRTPSLERVETCKKPTIGKGMRRSSRGKK